MYVKYSCSDESSTDIYIFWLYWIYNCYLYHMTSGSMWLLNKCRSTKMYCKKWSTDILVYGKLNLNYQWKFLFGAVEHAL